MKKTLKKIRNSLDMTREEMANYLGTKLDYYKLYENEVVGLPDKYDIKVKELYNKSIYKMRKQLFDEIDKRQNCPLDIYLKIEKEGFVETLYVKGMVI